MKWIAHAIKKKARTNEGLLTWLIVLWVLNAFLMNELSTEYFGKGDQLQGLYAFMSFTVFGLLTISIIKLSQHLIHGRIQKPDIRVNESWDEVDVGLSQNGLPRAIDKTAENTQFEKFIFLKVDGKIYKVLFDNLLYAEANGNCTRIVLENNVLQPTMTFSNLEELLPKNLFVRLHRSFIINKSKISHIEGNRVFIEKTEIPIGSNYRDGFLKEIGV